MRTEWSIKILGYCDRSIGDIEELAASGRLSELLKSRGNFVISLIRQSDAVVITSHGGVIPYYFGRANGRFAHGQTIAGVARALGIDWEWSFRALADYLCLDHVVGNDSLHSRVQRTPPGSIISFRGTELIVETADRVNLREERADPVKALELLMEEVLAWWTPESVLCITGGLDSRLLLAILLANGVRPRLLTAGQRGSFDLAVARAISARFNLPLTTCEIRISDFLECGSEIAARTDGLLPVSHWPGALLARYAPSSPLFLGFNGEFARSYYYDQGLASLLRDLLRIKTDPRLLLRKRFHVPFTEEDLKMVHPELASHLTKDAESRRCNRLIQTDLPFGKALDEVFYREYGRHKTGADLAAISGFAKPVTPFFSKSWGDEIRRLPRHWKLGSRFHRASLARLDKRLMEFPEEWAPNGATGAHVSLRYWLQSNGDAAPNALSFFDQSLYLSSTLLDMLISPLGTLEDVMELALLKKIYSCSRYRRAFFQLAALALAAHERSASIKPLHGSLFGSSPRVDTFTVPRISETRR